MKITFGVSCGQMTENQWLNLITSIEKQHIPNYEILMIGPEQRTWGFDKSIRYIEFDEHLNGKAWITKKKNLITEFAKYSNIVYLHDYFTFGNGWYDGWIGMKEYFDVGMNMVWIQEGEQCYRHSDWVVDPYLIWELHPDWHWKFWDVGLDYCIRGLSKVQYISGGFWIAKRSFMEENPLNESLAWGDAEDIDWSNRARQKTEFVLNEQSITWVNKPGKWKPGLLPETLLNELCAKHNLIIKYDY